MKSASSTLIVLGALFAWPGALAAAPTSDVPAPGALRLGFMQYCLLPMSMPGANFDTIAQMFWLPSASAEDSASIRALPMLGATWDVHQVPNHDGARIFVATSSKPGVRECAVLSYGVDSDYARKSIREAFVSKGAKVTESDSQHEIIAISQDVTVTLQNREAPGPDFVASLSAHSH